MREKPLTRQRIFPVGLVTGPNTIYGEWNAHLERSAGHTHGWANVPANARLYTPSYGAIWKPLVADGLAVANRWKNHGIISITFNGRTIVNIANQLDDYSTHEKLAALIEWTEFVRKHGAHQGSWAGTAYSLWRASLDGIVHVERGDPPPFDRIPLGSRIQNRNRGKFEHVQLWDLVSAFPHTMGTMEFPTRWTERRGPGWDEHAPGFAYAYVTIPPGFFGGPLGVDMGLSARARNVLGEWTPTTRFPTDETVEGVWTADELRMAIEFGCDVDIVTAWYGYAERPLFARWWEIIQAGRATLSEPAGKLLKRSANALWGRFSANGKLSRIWYDERGYHREQDVYEVKPRAATISGLIAGRVRERLYREAIEPFAPVVITVHTDGVMLPVGLEVCPNGGEPGTWRVKRKMEELLLLNANAYRFLHDGKERTVMAGRRGQRAVKSFDAWWEIYERRDRAAARGEPEGEPQGSAAEAEM